MRIAWLACWLLLLAGALFYRLDTAQAQGTDAERQACTPDAMRLCSEFIPDVAKVTACMKAKSRELSEPCRVAMRGGGKSSGRHEARERSHHYRGRTAASHGHCDPLSHLCS
jgi:hypothetical protein